MTAAGLEMRFSEGLETLSRKVLSAFINQVEIVEIARIESALRRKGKAET